ncbi:hypothetical protein P3F01_11145 [Clostridium perfringens]|uniref:hypothetical protein n=1 Tax=Clostridium perfringens TaxID=1502 RepID=UPI0028E11601|nr:hypothetical protein [Clostridium perfringens]MDT9336928.1 hypothetical protein [Clostridium perfringens]MDT9344684.1 hypothetical protein [Clostridium perfringens]MDT9347927.1 hypothetical protein [Clostridium perfringens]MDT9353609.1 hypothetical protein [Clostridium perfringens]
MENKEILEVLTSLKKQSFLTKEEHKVIRYLEKIYSEKVKNSYKKCRAIKVLAFYRDNSKEAAQFEDDKDFKEILNREYDVLDFAIDAIKAFEI